MRVRCFLLGGALTVLACGDASTPDPGDARAIMDAELMPDAIADASIDAPTFDALGPSDADVPDAVQGDADVMSRNLLINPSFEDGDTGWNLWGGASRVMGSAYDGSWSARLTDGNGAEQLVMGLEPNTVYRLSGWGRTEGEPLLLGVKNHGQVQETASWTSRDYRRAELIFTTGFATTSAIVFAYKVRGGEVAQADAMRLERVGPSELTLLWSDEFDGDGPVDRTKWSHEEGFVRNEELQWYQAENAFREGGLLVIEGRREDRPNPRYVAGSTDWRTSRERIRYSAASLLTSDLFEFQYGRVVVRAKVTNATGTWPAIWTLGARCEWPSSGEVDIMENYGGNILANFAWGTNRRWSPRWDSSRHPVRDMGATWTERFHIWELAWDEDRMTILLDGAVLNTVELRETVNGSAACAGENPFRQPHYLILNLALGGAGGSVDGLTFPTRYLVDYVRVYQ